jgi:tRNA threonylcarbamoyladenosine biosynthesis protein TsaB
VILLGFDTATPSTAVALRMTDGSILQARDDPHPGEHPGHATRLLAMAHELLEAAGIGWSALDRIAVGVGPGTFTGLRIGVATARGLAQSLACELVGISSLQALAAPALAQRQAQAVLAVIDARRGEVFAGAYEHGGDGGPHELASPRALAPEDLGSAMAEALPGDPAVADNPVDAVGPAPGGSWLAVGDGAVRFRGHLDSLGVAIPPDSSALHAVSAESVCELAAVVTPAADRQILPDYRRRPDAELALESAAAKAGPAGAKAVVAGER